MYIRRHVPSPSLLPRIPPPAPSTLYRASLRPFPGFACTRGQINVDGAPRAPFFCIKIRALSRIVLAIGSICPYLSVCPRDFFSDSQCIILIDYSLQRWFIIPCVLRRRNRESAYRRRHLAIEPSRFRAAIEPIFYASFPLCHKHWFVEIYNLKKKEKQRDRIYRDQFCYEIVVLLSAWI